MKLTEDQTKAYQAITDFLLEPRTREMILTGAGGSGKSALVSWFLLEGYDIFKANHPEAEPYVPVVVATTNKAAKVIGEQTKARVPTIHSFLGLAVKEDEETGTTSLKVTKKFKPKSGLLVFIDECSMIDEELYFFINEALQECKIIYLGDKDQLAPVKQKYPTVFTKGFPLVELTQNVRMRNYPALLDLASQLKRNVNEHKLNPIKVDPSVVSLLDKEEYLSLINKEFKKPNLKNKILAFTNKRVLEYNHYIKYDLRHYSNPYVVGECYIINSAVTNPTDEDHSVVLFQTDTEVQIEAVLGEHEYEVDDYILPVVALSLSDGQGVLAPANNEEYLKILKRLVRKKQWADYFQLKRDIVDLRLSDCSTVHKAQGSTYTQVFVDLEDISKCRDLDTLNRLLYVACTRATTHVYLYRGNNDKIPISYSR